MLKDVGKLNFDVQMSMSDDDFVNLTGLTKQQFDVVATHVTDLRNSEVRSIRTCLTILLFKLRTGLSNTILGILFSLKSYNIRRFPSSPGAIQLQQQKNCLQETMTIKLF